MNLLALRSLALSVATLIPIGAQICETAKTSFSAMPINPVLERGSLVTIAYSCIVETGRPAVAPKPDLTNSYELLMNGLAISRRVQLEAKDRLVFELVDTDEDATRAKALSELWKTLSASGQLQLVPTLSLQKTDKDKKSERLDVAGRPQLYTLPSILSLKKGCPNTGSGTDNSESEGVCKEFSKGDAIEVEVANWKKLQADAGTSPIYLLLEGKPMGVFEKPAPGAGASNKFRFRLTSDGVTDAETKVLLASWQAVMATRGYAMIAYPVAIGTATNVLTTQTLQPQLIQLKRVKGLRFLFWVAFVLAAVGSLFWLGWKSELLRETCPPPLPPGTRRAFSLAKVQMAFWFAITLSAVALYWAVLQEELKIPENLLALIGISGGTFVLARAVDNTTAVSKGDAPVPTTGSFFHDLLTSANGVELHRFQMVVWTLFFGFMVIREFATTLALPDPSATSLTLMGLSSGLYVTLKIPEKKP